MSPYILPLAVIETSGTYYYVGKLNIKTQYADIY